MNICTYYLEFDVDAIIHTRKHRMTNDYCHYIYLAVSVLNVKQIDVNAGACFGEVDY